MVEITKCPPGYAQGAGDLAEWAHRRAVGKSGVAPPRKIKTKRKRKRSAFDRVKANKVRRAERSKAPAVTPRTDFSDMNVYDMSVMPWDENQVIPEHAATPAKQYND